MSVLLDSINNQLPQNPTSPLFRQIHVTFFHPGDYALPIIPVELAPTFHSYILPTHLLGSEKASSDTSHIYEYIGKILQNRSQYILVLDSASSLCAHSFFIISHHLLEKAYRLNAGWKNIRVSSIWRCLMKYASSLGAVAEKRQVVLNVLLSCIACCDLC